MITLYLSILLLSLLMMSKNEKYKRFYRSEKERESYIIRYNEKNISLNIINEYQAKIWKMSQSL